MLKKVSTIVGLCLLLAACGVQNQKIYPYSFDTTHAEFSITGTTNGKSTVYIKGDKYIQEFHGTKKENDTESPLNTLTLKMDGYVYQIDLDTKKGTKAEDGTYQTLKETPADKKMQKLVDLQVGAANPGVTGEDSINSNTIVTKTGTKQVAGKTCDLYAMTFKNNPAKAEVCLWEGLSLYTALNISEINITNTSSATLVETNVSVSDDKFKVPEGITFQE